MEKVIVGKLGIWSDILLSSIMDCVQCIGTVGLESCGMWVETRPGFMVVVLCQDLPVFLLAIDRVNNQNIYQKWSVFYLTVTAVLRSKSLINLVEAVIDAVVKLWCDHWKVGKWVRFQKVIQNVYFKNIATPDINCFRWYFMYFGQIRTVGENRLSIV